MDPNDTQSFMHLLSGDESQNEFGNSSNLPPRPQIGNTIYHHIIPHLIPSNIRHNTLQISNITIHHQTPLHKLLPMEQCPFHVTHLNLLVRPQ